MVLICFDTVQKNAKESPESQGKENQGVLSLDAFSYLWPFQCWQASEDSTEAVARQRAQAAAEAVQAVAQAIPLPKVALRLFQEICPCVPCVLQLALLAIQIAFTGAKDIQKIGFLVLICFDTVQKNAKENPESQGKENQGVLSLDAFSYLWPFQCWQASEDSTEAVARQRAQAAAEAVQAVAQAIPLPKVALRLFQEIRPFLLG